MLKGTRDTGVVLPTYAWTMLTPSCVTSSLVKNCPPVNVIFGALLQRNNIPVFIFSLNDFSFFKKHKHHRNQKNISILISHMQPRPPRYLLQRIFRLKKRILVESFYRFQTSRLDMFLPWYVISLAVNTRTTKSGFSGDLKYCSNIGFQYFFFVPTSSWILPFALIST